MNKLGYASQPTKQDYVKLTTSGGDPIDGIILQWGVEEWGQKWAILKKDDEIVQVNIANIITYSLIKNSDSPAEYQIVRKAKEKIAEEQTQNEQPETEKEEVFKIKASYNDFPKYKIVKRGTPKQISFSRSINEKTGVIERDIEKDLFSNKNTIDKSKALLELYEEKRRLAQQDIKDHLTNKDLRDIKEVYELPSFTKRST